MCDMFDIIMLYAWYIVKHNSILSIKPSHCVSSWIVTMLTLILYRISSEVKPVQSIFHFRYFLSLGQWSVNYLLPMDQPLPLRNKVLLQHSHAHSLMYCLWLVLWELNVCNKHYMVHKPKIFTIQAFKKNIANLCGANPAQEV